MWFLMSVCSVCAIVTGSGIPSSVADVIHRLLSECESKSSGSEMPASSRARVLQGLVDLAGPRFRIGDAGLVEES
jgi:hypothetical protein